MAVPLTLLAKALLVDADPHMVWLGTLLTPHEPSHRGRTTDRRPNGSNDGSVRRRQHRSARP